MLLADGIGFFSRGIADLPPADKTVIVFRVLTFDDFDPENDPYCEHDFGAFDHNGDRIFWKIDYYDLQMRQASPD